MTRLLAWAIASLVALAVATGCSGSSPMPNGSPQAPPGGGTAMEAAGPSPPQAPPQSPPVERDVVKTASMTMTVSDPSAAADEAAVIVERADGRVDSRTEDAGSGTGRAVTSLVLRVPVAALDEVMRQLKELGTVQTATTTAEDVTAQRVDLDARIRALQTSVDRLLAIMRDARDPEALIAAEDALSERQAELDSLRAQREALGDRIAYSTIDVRFDAERVGGPAPQQYQGFFGQVHRGWDAMVEVAGNALLLFGLLLPWLGATLLVGVIGYGLIRWLSKRTRPRPGPAGEAPAPLVTPPAGPEQSHSAAEDSPQR